MSRPRGESRGNVRTLGQAGSEPGRSQGQAQCPRPRLECAPWNNLPRGGGGHRGPYLEMGFADVNWGGDGDELILE